MVLGNTAYSELSISADYTSPQIQRTFNQKYSGGGGQNSRRGCPGSTELLPPSSWAVALCKPISQEPLHLVPTGQSPHSLRISGERTQVPVLSRSLQGAGFLGKPSLSVNSSILLLWSLNWVTLPWSSMTQPDE